MAKALFVDIEHPDLGYKRSVPEKYLKNYINAGYRIVKATKPAEPKEAKATKPAEPKEV